MTAFPSILKQISATASAIIGSQQCALPPVAGDLRSDGDGVTLDKPEKLRAHLDSLLKQQPLHGWLLWSESLQIVRGDLPSLPDGRGWLLAAELSSPVVPEDPKSPNCTWTVRQAGTGWHCQSLQRCEAPPNQALGLPAAFVEIRELLAFPQIDQLKGLRLRYEIAWRLTQTHTPTYRPAISRFAGFSPAPLP